MKTFILLSFFIIGLNVIAQEESHLQGSDQGIQENNAVVLASNTVHASVLEVEVFPNPSAGQLTVEGKNGSTVTVYSTSGIYVGTWVIGAEEKISLEDLTTGSYICAVELEGARCVKRFVVL